MKDELFKGPMSKAVGFEFNRDVAEVFDDMLSRSIPFYGEVQNMILDYVNDFYQPGTAIYDLGCSTGMMIAKLAASLKGVDKIVGVDNSRPMIDKAGQLLAKIPSQIPIELACRDIRDVQIENASAVVMNYTLQFIRPLYRARVLGNIFRGLRPGGIFILSEKVLEESTQISRLFIDMYYRFKRRQGYSEMEISQKRECLENVLIPYKVKEHYQLLEKCGFEQVEPFFKWNNFASFIAIKRMD